MVVVVISVVARFTPTGVGTITISRSPLGSVAVHPHGRGDNVTYIAARLIALGSPPRAWGQLTEFTGSIAACTVHPHGRGDNNAISHLCRSTRGSPPRAWGQWYGASGVVVRRRFTPTGVGTIADAPSTRAHPPVHPHGRGDNYFNIAVAPNVLAVHPHGRGDNASPILRQ